MANFENEIFDLVICHPPYVAAVPYAEFQRLSLMWLGYDPKYYDSVLIGGKRSRKDVYDKFMISMKDVIIEIKRVLKKGKTLENSSLEEMDKIWNEVKKKARA